MPGIGDELRRFIDLATHDRDAARTRIRRGLGLLRARWLFRNCERGILINALNDVHVVAHGKVSIGDRVQFWEGMIAHQIVCAEGGEVSIGTLSLFNYGVSLRAAQSIRIGERCMFGALVYIDDSGRDGVAPIVIGDDVWIAHGAIVGPGVTIGNGSVVGAGSVVLTDVPPFSLAVGNPASCSPLTPEAQRSGNEDI